MSHSKIISTHPVFLTNRARRRAMLGFLAGLALGFSPTGGGPCAAQAPPLGYGVAHSFLPLGTGNIAPGGSGPTGALTIAPDGSLYGVTRQGGANGTGMIFHVRPDGTGFQSVCDFSSLSTALTNTEGAFPFGALLLGSDGSLYGTAEAGGANGTGTLFQIPPGSSTAQPLYTFSATNSSGNNADGAEPYNGLTNGGDGFFYGVTRQGGANSNGTVFQISSAGSGFTTLHSFASATDGYEPNGALAAPGDGFLYGTAQNGGPNGGAGGTGTVFTLKTDGTGFLVLHAFSAASSAAPYGNSDGVYPSAGLTPGPGGFLYGMAQSGGTNGKGTVYHIQPDGTNFQAIYSFSALTGSANADGASPSGSSLTPGADGRLYGAAGAGGANGDGTVFRLQPDGTGFQTLVSFNETNGKLPRGTPVFGPDGFLYGSAASGGSVGTGSSVSVGGGVLYRLTPVHTHMLWNTADGRATVITADSLGNASFSPVYGPYPGWKATAIATGPDGLNHLLWTHPSDGTAILCLQSVAGPLVFGLNDGPYANWSAAALTVGADGLSRLLWNYAGSFAFDEGSTGPAALWTVGNTGAFTYQLYGPYDTWAAVAAASSLGPVSHLLWRNTAGVAALWTIDGIGQIGISPNYGPFPGWQANSLAVGLQGERELLWDHASDGTASLWRVAATGYQTISPSYGPYSGYVCVGVTADPAGVPHLLWSHPSDGTASLWTLDTAGDVPGSGTSAVSVYGPYADGQGGYWTPSAASAGP